MTERQYDVVLYGASGFTGKQTVQYFATHAPAGQVRWAIAGRNRQKLEAVKAEFVPPSQAVDILVADSHDSQALDQIAAQTQVVLNTAGPFALYGNAIVAACVQRRTHYVDITGETPWVRDLIDRHQAQAAADGTRIIPCCGFDSVPSDLGTYLVVRQIQRDLGLPCQQVKGYFQAFGGFNGGTLASGFNLSDSGRWHQVQQPFLLNPPGEHSPEDIERNRDPLTPAYDPEIGAWVAPFFMGPINTRVVRRSSALFGEWQAPYGPNFTYQEFFKFDPPLDWLQAAGVTAGMALAGTLLQSLPLRQLLQPLLPQPGTGPTPEIMDQGWFRGELLGTASNGQRYRGLICDRGDPGNRATVKFLCESALSLVLNQEALPGGPHRGGILTPATGLGEVLAQRLRNAGMTLEVAKI